MGRKTASKKYQLQDQLRLLRRQFLSYSDDYEDICYQSEEPQLPAPVKTPNPETIPTATPVVTNSPEAELLVAPSLVVVPVEDKLLSALEIVIALTAQKLKRAFDEVPTEKSIRDLSGGKLNTPYPKAIKHMLSDNRQIHIAKRTRWRLDGRVWWYPGWL
jgi:fatty acid synthase subunit alpha